MCERATVHGGFDSLTSSPCTSQELLLLWQSAARESSSETIPTKNNQYKTAEAFLNRFYAAHHVLNVECMHQSLFSGRWHISYTKV